jgi:hypothetical protein
MGDHKLEIQKRHTLNWLIQGAAQHAGMTFHHMVRDELNALDPELLLLYDQYALINLLQYWQPEARSFDSPTQFWQEAATKPDHPYFSHPLLSKFGGLLAEAGRQRGQERWKEKGFIEAPGLFWSQAKQITQRIRVLEAPHQLQLVKLAKQTASTVWGIPLERLDAELCAKIILQPEMLPVRNRRGAMFRSIIVGYGCVERIGDKLMVVGKGTNWQLLCKELVKGTAELICLHGLNQLDDETYGLVLGTTDHLDLEPSMLQSGGEFWRRILVAFPDRWPLSRTLMHLARLPGGALERLVAEMLEHPERAEARLAKMFPQK